MSGGSPKPAVREIEPVDRGGAQRVIDRFENSLRMSEGVCRQFGVESLFFIQPDPVHNYPLNLYREPPPQSFLQS